MEDERPRILYVRHPSVSWKGFSTVERRSSIRIVIPANAGIHFDFDFDFALASIWNVVAKIKMDSSVRWDDGTIILRWDDVAIF